MTLRIERSWLAALAALGLATGQVSAAEPSAQDMKGEYAVTQRLAAGALDTQTGLVFSSQGDGTLSTIRETSPNHFVVQRTASTQRGAPTLALNPDNHHVYLVSAEFDEVAASGSEQRPRRVMRPGRFVLLVMGEK